MSGFLTPFPLKRRSSMCYLDSSLFQANNVDEMLKSIREYATAPVGDQDKLVCFVVPSNGKMSNSSSVGAASTASPVLEQTVRSALLCLVPRRINHNWTSQGSCF